MTPALAELARTLLPPMLCVEGRLFRLTDQRDALFWVSIIGGSPADGVVTYVETAFREPRRYVVVDLSRVDPLSTDGVLSLVQHAVLTLRDRLSPHDPSTDADERA